MKLVWACVGLARAGKTLAVRRGRRIGDGSRNVLLTSRMKTILNDAIKFLDLGPVTNKDNTAKIESRTQQRLLQLRKECLISKEVYEAIRPTGSQRLRMYGLPKIHKKDVPLRPILSMTGSAQHQLAKWLTSFLQPVLQNLSSNCVSDSFTFVKEVRKIIFSSSSFFLCSFVFPVF